MTDQELRELLAGPVPGEEAALAEVRWRVLARVRRRWWPVWAGAAVAAGLLLWAVPLRLPPVEPMQVAGRAPAAPVLAVGAPQPVPPVVHARAPRPRAVRPQPVTEQVVVKMVTDDPEVVILWLGD